MARILSRNPTPRQEHAYYQWAEKYLWNDRRCDHCTALLPEDDMYIHDCWDNHNNFKIPKTVYCSNYCYSAARQPRVIVRGDVSEKQKDWAPVPDPAVKLNWR